MPRQKLVPVSPDEIEAAYYDALSRADIDEFMSLWAEDEDIVCIHPSAQRLVGHAAIRSSWQDILSQGGLHIRPRLLRKTHNLMTAVHSVIENIPHADTTTQEIHITATNVYMKTAQGWRIVMHHASVCPGAAPADANTGTTFH